MSALAIVLIVIAAVVLALFVLGSVAVRRRRVGHAEFQSRLDAANRALADARAGDQGWDLPALEAVAREAAARRAPDANVRSVRLVQCIDNPGTDEDRAIFRADVARGRDFDVVLGRREGAWVELEPRR